MKDKKSLLEKFRALPPPVKLLGSMILFWIYPLIETMLRGGSSGYGDFSIFSIIMLIMGGIILGYLTVTHLFIPVGGWIASLFKKKQ